MQRGRARARVSSCSPSWHESTPFYSRRMKLSGSVALVTGGASGLGAATARRLASGGARGVIVDRGERGVSVTTASLAAFAGQIGEIGYAASTAGGAGRPLPAARARAPAGIRVVTIAPGIFDTPMLGALPADKRAALAADVVFP